MTDGDEYLPVPTMRREVKVLPAIANVSMRGLSTTNEIHDFNLIAVADQDLVESAALDYDQIVFDGHSPRVDRELREQLGHGDRLDDLVRIAVENYGHVKRILAQRCDSDGLTHLRTP
jgi:hypothetical protein